MPLGRGKSAKTRAMTASAARLKVDRRVTNGRAVRKPANWQERAYTYYDDVPEVGDGVGFFANSCSRLRFFAAVLDDDGQPRPVNPDDDGQALYDECVATMALIGEGPAQAAVTRPLAVNLELAGEAYLQGCIDPDTGDESIRVRSVSEVDDVDGRIAVRDLPGATAMALDPALSPTFDRVWRPHPRFQSMPDSPMVRLIDVCEELLLLSQSERAGDRSRLARSGINFFDSRVQLPPSGPDDSRDKAGRLLDALVEAATSAITNEGSAAAAVPIFVEIEAPAGMKVSDMVFLQTYDRPADPTTLPRREALIRRIGHGLDLPPDVLTGMQNVKYCADDRTECLTRRGWKRYDEVQVGEDVLTLNHTSGLAEWQPAVDVSHFDVVDEPMLAMRSRSHSSLTTMDHRWAVVRRRKDGSLVREWTTSADFTNADGVERAAPCVNLPTEAKYTDEFVELVAWFWTEGHLRPAKPTIYPGRNRRRWADLSQSHERYPENVTRIRRALQALYGPPSDVKPRTAAASVPYLAGDPRTPVYRETVGTRGCTTWLFNEEAIAPVVALMDADKVIDPAFIASLTRSQLELFVTVSVLADGNSRPTADTIWQKVPARLDAFEMACALLGRPTSRGAEQQHLSISARRNRVTPWSRRFVQTYSGVVWCPTTPNQTWLARRDGQVYFTGNSNAIQIDKNVFRHYVEPFAVVMADALTVSILRPGLLANSVDPLTVRSVFVWYDPTELVSEPDLAEPAQSVFDAGEMSGVALRRYKSFNDDDAPTPVERALRLAEKLKVDPATAQALIAGVATGQLAPDADLTSLQLPAPALPATANGATGTGAASTIDGQPVTAAAGAAMVSTRPLVDLDREVRTRLHAECEVAVSAALRKAASRLAAAAQKDTAARGLAASASRRELPAILGPAVCASLVAPAAVGELAEQTPALLASLAADELLRGALDDLRARVTAILTAAQTKAVAVAAGLAGDGAVRPASSVLEGWRSAAVDYLTGSLSVLLGTRLFAPAPAEEPTTVPMAVARAAVAVASGLPEGHGGFSAEGLPLTPGDSGVGLATGRISADIFSSAGLPLIEYEWNYGVTAAGRQFEPHYALNGLRFTSFTDDALANPESFPPEPFYSAGDHDGCACDVIPIYDSKGGMAGTGDEPNLGADEPVYAEPIAAGATR